MTIGEINAVINARVESNNQQSGTLTKSDYKRLLDKFKEAKKNERSR